MKKTPLSLIALLSITTAVSVQAACKSHATIQDDGKGAYVIDSDNDIVRDSWGACVRTNYWTADIANEHCEGHKEKKIVISAPVAAPAPAPVIAPAAIQDDGKGAYVIDSDNDIVRDSWGACVRTNYWTADIANEHCEGHKEKKIIISAPVAAPAPVVAPALVAAPALVVAPAPVVIAEPVSAVIAPAAFRGLFDTGSAVLKDAAHTELDLFADFMVATPSSKIIITGHTDNVGTNANNQKLSEARAIAVKNYLEGKGISTNRMTTMGAGEASPIADNGNAAGRTENRRVEVDFVK
ncbi:MAG: OmpA-OmpF porin, OOP family [Thiomicrorhabdus sp.]|nr:MAG: OmpA-OmpF porin, OOP family [Thiomicrorhabdus sp.]